MGSELRLKVIVGRIHQAFEAIPYCMIALPSLVPLLLLDLGQKFSCLLLELLLGGLEDVISRHVMLKLSHSLR